MSEFGGMQGESKGSGGIGLWSRFCACLAGFAIAAVLIISHGGAGSHRLAAMMPALHEGVVLAGGPVANDAEYRVLAPIESGNLLLFPVVRESVKGAAATGGFLTLDEGLKNGTVEVTEAGRVRGLVRRRDDGPLITGGDQVNTLVLVNNSGKPLVLLAGEIVTGGKQDRVIAKDRIVPAGGDPIDLGVFCIEPGRWTVSSPVFGASAKIPAASIMVQPTVREQAMVSKDQQMVWDSVHGSLAHMAAAAAPPRASGPDFDGMISRPLQTSSYAKAVQSDEVRSKVDEAVAPVMQSRDAVMAELRKQGAVGVVVAVRGEIVWADIFASTDLLARYWTKLVRSYAAESLNPGDTKPAPSVADAQRFLESPTSGTENSEGSVGVYRYRELKSGGTETFVLESLLPDARGEVHISKLKVRQSIRRPISFHGGPRLFREETLPPPIQPLMTDPAPPRPE